MPCAPRACTTSATSLFGNYFYSISGGLSVLPGRRNPRRSDLAVDLIDPPGYLKFLHFARGRQTWQGGNGGKKRVHFEENEEALPASSSARFYEVSIMDWLRMDEVKLLKIVNLYYRMLVKHYYIKLKKEIIIIIKKLQKILSIFRYRKRKSEIEIWPWKLFPLLE